MIKDRIVTYAQNREDIILSGFFDDDETGFYVDIGANHPTHESVTKYFYDRGWHGINVEPLNHLHQQLQRDRPRDINLAVGVGDEQGTAVLHYYPNGDGLSTMSDTMATGYKGVDSEFTNEESTSTVKVVTLKEIFGQHLEASSIQFMKVDVEGFEYEVLLGNDWKKYRPEVICIEANHVDKDWHPLLKKERYSLVFFDGLNEYYADDTTGRASKFNYIRGVIFKEPIVNFRLLEDFKEYDELVAWLEATIQNTKDKAQAERLALNTEIKNLQHALNEITPLRRHAVKHFKHRLARVDQKITTRLSRQAMYKPVAVDDSTGDLDELLARAQANDIKNAASFGYSHKQHPFLPAYNRSKRTTHQAVRKALKKVIKDK